MRPCTKLYKNDKTNRDLMLNNSNQISLEMSDINSHGLYERANFIGVS